MGAARVSLIDTYERYKLGTNKAVKWLCGSAELCQPGATKPKKPSRPGGPRKIQTDDLIGFAEIIARDPDGKVAITAEILGILQDAIDGRRQCSKWYKALAKARGTGHSESDVTHWYFLETLQKVFEILCKGLTSRLPSRKRKMPELPTGSNLYQHLGFDETVDNEDEALNRCASGKAQTKAPTVEFEIDNPEVKREEMLLAIWAHLEDLHEIRKHARHLMHQFVKGELSFLVTANAILDAMHVGAVMASGLAEEYSCLNHFDDIIEAVGKEWFYSVAEHVKYDFSRVLTPGWEQAETQAELLCVDGWTAIATVRKMNDLDAMLLDPNYEKRKLGHCSSPRQSTPLHPFTHILVAACQELDRIKRVNKNNRLPGNIECLAPHLDAYSYGYLYRMQTGPMDLGIVVGTALYADLHDVLQGEMELGFSVCKPIVIDQSKAMADLLRKFAETESDQIKAHLPEGRDLARFLENLEGKVTSHTDGYGNSGWLLHAQGSDHGALVSTKILAALPLTAASIARSVCEARETAGVYLCNIQYTILGIAHLRKGCAAFGQVEDWPDMNLLAEAKESGARPFLRQTESPVGAVAKEYAKALGFNGVLTRGKPDLKARDFAEYSTAAILKGGIRSAKIRAQHQKLNRQLGLQHEISLRGHYDAIRQYASTTGIQDLTIVDQWEQTTKLSAAQLLSVLHEIEVYEQPFYYFDYAGFHSLCLQLMEYVTQKYLECVGLREQLNVDASLWYFEVVYEALWEAEACDRIGGWKGGVALSKMAQIVSAMIKKDGSKFLTSSREATERQTEMLRSVLGTASSASSLLVQIDWTSLAKDSSRRIKQMIELDTLSLRMGVLMGRNDDSIDGMCDLTEIHGRQRSLIEYMISTDARFMPI